MSSINRDGVLSLPVVARDGNVLGMSRSVPSSPGERQSPSDRPGVTEIETSEQGAQVSDQPPASSPLYSNITGLQSSSIFAFSLTIRVDLALIVLKVRQAIFAVTK